MLLKYGNIYTTVCKADPYIHATIADLLTVVEEDGTEYCLYDDDERRFLSGLLPHVCEALRRQDIPFGLQGRTFPNLEVPEVPAEILATADHPNFRLYEYQRMAVRKAVIMGRGIIRAATGAGKTEIYTAMIKHIEQVEGRRVRSLLLMPAVRLAEQTCERLRKRGLDSVVMAEAGVLSAPGRHVVGVVNTVYRGILKQQEQLLGVLDSVDVLGVDESHHQSSKMHMTVAFSCNAKYRYGLSATPFADKDSPYTNISDLAMIGALGTVVVDIPSAFLRSAVNPLTGNTYLPNPKVVFIDCPHDRKKFGFLSSTNQWVDTSKWSDVQDQCVVNNQYRNGLIRRLAYWRSRQEGAKVLILVSKHEHGHLLMRMLDELGVRVACMFGGGYAARVVDDQVVQDITHDEVVERFSNGALEVLIGSPHMDEGLSFPAVTDLIMAGAGRGGASFRRLYQKIGRSLHSDNVPNVYDFFDHTHYMLKAQSKARIRALESEEFVVEQGIPTECMYEIPDRTV